MSPRQLDRPRPLPRSLGGASVAKPRECRSNPRRLLAGGAAWPLAARAQQPGRVRRVGVLMSVAADGPDGQPRLAAFLKGLQQLGWTDGRNVADRQTLEC
jgi:hypothetical protein